MALGVQDFLQIDSLYSVFINPFHSPSNPCQDSSVVCVRLAGGKSTGPFEVFDDSGTVVGRIDVLLFCSLLLDVSSPNVLAFDVVLLDVSQLDRE
jgi:hypothetical protein